MKRFLLDRVLGLGDMPGAGRWAMVSLIDATGSGMLAPISMLYFTQRLGLSPAAVGLGLTIAGLAALCLAPVAGVAIDMFGAKATMIGCWTLAALGYGGYGLVDRWGQFVVVATMALLSGYAAKPAKQCFLADMARPEDRPKLLAFQRSVRNAGYSLGGLLATAALAAGEAGYLVVIYADALSFLLAIALVVPIRTPHMVQTDPPRSREAVLGFRAVVDDRRYLMLSALDFLCSFHATALTIAVPLWVALHTDAPKAVVGILFSLNTILVVLLQVRTAARVRAVADVTRSYRLAAVSFGIAASTYAVARYAGPAAAVVLLLAGVLFHTAAELFTAAGEWVISIELADDAHRGKYLSVFWLATSLQNATGPAIITAVLAATATGLWPVLASLFAVGTLTSARLLPADGRPEIVPAAVSAAEN